MGRRKIITVETGRPDIFGQLDIELNEKETELFLYLDESRSLEELIRRVQTILWREMGISDFSHSPLVNNLGVLDPCGTYDRKYTDRYATEGLYQGDLVVKHLVTDKTPIFRSDISAHIETATYNVDIFKMHREASYFIAKCGLRDVYTIPVIGNDYLAAVSFSTHQLDPLIFRERINKNLKALALLARFIDVIGRHRFPASFHPSLNPRIPIPQRALQLIDIVIRKDCNVKDAAQLMGIELSTANKHLKKLKTALNTETIQGTCVAALRERLIVLD